ncbi:MAG: hypothetical protein LBT09_13675 [Planctomycetaceae bacterium]|nr:hypothetical protein [Planctomycetaceae bacterium]
MTQRNGYEIIFEIKIPKPCNLCCVQGCLSCTCPVAIGTARRIIGVARCIVFFELNASGLNLKARRY